MPQSLGIAHFVSQADALGVTILAILTAMSVASWYLIFTRAWLNFSERRTAVQYLAEFRKRGSLAMSSDERNAFCALTNEARAVAEHISAHGAERLPDTGAGELITRSLRVRTQREIARRESGLTFLAATASSAPFIGLFGTVWGIYQALIGIGMSGQGTLERIAGPVGEALVMTGAGLAVAIPAAMSYNFFVRANRRMTGEMHAFANELLLLAATGTALNAGSASRDPARQGGA